MTRTLLRAAFAAALATTLTAGASSTAAAPVAASTGSATADCTGAEMEALISVTVAALAVIDMAKGVDRSALAPGPGPGRLPPGTHTRTPIYERRVAHNGLIPPLSAVPCSLIPSLVCDTRRNGCWERTGAGADPRRKGRLDSGGPAEDTADHCPHPFEGRG